MKKKVRKNMFRMTIPKMSLLSALATLFLLVAMLASSGKASAHTANGCQPQQVYPPCPPSHFHDLYWSTSFEVWGYNGTSSDLIDDNQIGLTNGNQVSGQFGAIVTVLAHGGNVYEVRRTSTKTTLFAVVYGGCTTATGYCLIELDDSFVYYVAAGTTGLYESRASSIWQLTGLCFHCWAEIGKTSTESQYVLRLVAASRLYAWRADGTVWRYNGTPYNWTEVDSQPNVNRLDLAIDTHNVLYERREVDHNGQPSITNIVQGHGPFNFQLIDGGHLVDKIVADSRLYEWNADGSIQLYEGTPNNWAYILASPTAQDVEAGAASDAVYWEPSDNSIWRYTPEMGASAIVGPSSDTLQMSQQGVRLSALL